ncbi:site-specific DNA-methyltransferase [Ruminiclostridium cellobioparum]|uniref:site-specific DNA-methyltransferase n=1 Tax=Ruminiclostridium cellobioparum TaxID=29355 RepID=UPI0028A6B0A4|nr:site-specific DNA-methyltransferase [Ruminiclostridium cellobioparum]
MSSINYNGFGSQINVDANNLEQLELLDREDLIKLVKRMVNGGVSLMFHGKRIAQQIQKQVKPRTVKIRKELSFGSPEEQAKNLIIEGENLQAMVTLYKFKGKVDLIVTDPPYNTGQYFRYSDKWEKDPNDPDMGTLVTMEDGSKHTKWMKAMLPRLQLMKAMLKPGGVLAICIDDNELFHLGMMLDEVFGEENRIAIINWQKAYSPKNDSKHVSTATEYVLVYARDKERAKTGLLTRDESMNMMYKNPDNDPEGVWTGGDPTAATPSERDRYAIQSPFTGALHYPGTGAWRNPKRVMKELLESWGTKYIEKDIGDGRAKALVIKDAIIPKINDYFNLDHDPIVEDDETNNCEAIIQSRKKAEMIRNNKTWPLLFFLKDGYGRPRFKRHLKHVKRGKVPMTYWADEDYNEPIVLGAQSWDHEESGHSQAGINELDAIIGKGHGFQTVKPLKLIKKIIQLWCPSNGLILDPYAGSGTTGHAIVELNCETGTNRRFIMIEQGNPETGDQYAKSLTRERIKRAITGERPDKDGNLGVVAEPLGGGFTFQTLEKQVDAKAVLSMKRDEIVDVVIFSHWDDDNRKTESSIVRVDGTYKYLVGKNSLDEGYFIIWDGKDSVGQLDTDTYEKIVTEAKKAKLKTKYHVYARYQMYKPRSVTFYKIPDKILSHLGLNEQSERYNIDDEGGDE